jgi:hypothetical protein
MTYDYGQQSVWITVLEAEPNPHCYELCAPCAERITAPRGWVLTDIRARPLFEATG